MTETTIAPIDGHTAYDLLAAAVELAGRDHTVDRCRYTQPEGGNPCCMVGVALSIHGVPIDVLQDWDEGGVSGRRDFMGSISHAVGVYDWLSDDAVRVFSAAQRVQDEELPWGSALSKAGSTLKD